MGKIKITNVNVDKILTVACVGAVVLTYALGIYTGSTISDKIETYQETKADEQLNKEIAKERFSDYDRSVIMNGGIKRTSDLQNYYYDTWQIKNNIINVCEKNGDPVDLGLYTAYNVLDTSESDKTRDHFMNELILNTTRHPSFDEYLISCGHIDEEGNPSVSKWKQTVKKYKEAVIEKIKYEREIQDLIEQQNITAEKEQSSKDKLYTKGK